MNNANSLSRLKLKNLLVRTAHNNVLRSPNFTGTYLADPK